jgi:Na+-driven multidrug efflux pump
MPYVGAAIVMWQLQETTRTAFFSHFRQRDALPGDVISYLGQALVMILLSRFGRLSLETVFLAMSATSLAGFVLQAAQLRLRWPRRGGWSEVAGDASAYGMWGLPARISMLFSVQAFPWMLFHARGAAAAAAFQALTSAVSFTNPVTIGTGNLVTATVARDIGPERFAAATRHAAYGLAVLALPMALVVAFPDLVLRTLYGRNAEYVQYAGLLWMMVAASVCDGIAMQVTCMIGGVGDTRAIFNVQATGLALAIVLGLPLAAFGGLSAALAGFFIVQLGRLIRAAYSWSQLTSPRALSPARSGA